MGKIWEYIKLIPKGIQNIPEIVDGIRNNVKLENGTLDEESVEIITGRRLICSVCPYNSINATKAGWYASDRNDVHCTQCGCPINIRTASLDADCGIADYNEKHPNTPLELKWTKQKTDENKDKSTSAD